MSKVVRTESELRSEIANQSPYVIIGAEIAITSDLDFGATEAQFAECGKLDVTALQPVYSPFGVDDNFPIPPNGTQGLRLKSIRPLYQKQQIFCDYTPDYNYDDKQRGDLSPNLVDNSSNSPVPAKIYIEGEVHPEWFGAKDGQYSWGALQAALFSTLETTHVNGQYEIDRPLRVQYSRFRGGNTTGRHAIRAVASPEWERIAKQTDYSGRQTPVIEIGSDTNWGTSYHNAVTDMVITCGDLPYVSGVMTPPQGDGGAIQGLPAIGELTEIGRLRISGWDGVGIGIRGIVQWANLHDLWVIEPRTDALFEQSAQGAGFTEQWGVWVADNLFSPLFTMSRGTVAGGRSNHPRKGGSIHLGARNNRIQDIHTEAREGTAVRVGADRSAIIPSNQIQSINMGEVSAHVDSVDVRGSGNAYGVRRMSHTANNGTTIAPDIVVNQLRAPSNSIPQVLFRDELRNKQTNSNETGVMHYSHQRQDSNGVVTTSSELS